MPSAEKAKQVKEEIQTLTGWYGLLGMLVGGMIVGGIIPLAFLDTIGNWRLFAGWIVLAVLAFLSMWRMKIVERRFYKKYLFARSELTTFQRMQAEEKHK